MLEAEPVKDRSEKSLFIKTTLECTDDENKKILASLQDKLDSNEYNYDENFLMATMTYHAGRAIHSDII